MNKILIIDDDLTSLEGHIRLLERNGYLVERVETGRAGLQAVIKGGPQLVILDVVLPDMNGYDVCHQIKSLPDLPPTYIVLFSAQCIDVESHVRGFDAGADDYLVKPIDRKHLLARVKAIFRTIRAEQERESLKEQLVQSHKMEAIGTLAGGIAHDFNNIIGVVLGNAEFVLECLTAENPFYEPLLDIQEASLRAKSLVKQILDFSRKANRPRSPHHLHQILTESIKLLRSFLPVTIQIKTRIVTHDDLVLCDSTQIAQVVLNLGNNAVYAMGPKGGTLSVELENVEMALDTNNPGRTPVPVQWVRLSVGDTGTGIDPLLLDRIFDPYFTTKPVGKGSGLGLSVVYGIVKAHGGEIKVDSRIDQGTTFHVYFPLEESEIVSPREESPPIRFGNECILFIDDEESIVRMAGRMLKMMGYRVECQTNPLEALELFRNKPDRFDLVISDMTMPGITGDEMAEALLKIRPDIPIILCTGHSEIIDEARAKEIGIRAFKMKPLDTGDLAVTIRQVLNPNPV